MQENAKGKKSKKKQKAKPPSFTFPAVDGTDARGVVLVLKGNNEITVHFTRQSGVPCHYPLKRTEFNNLGQRATNMVRADPKCCGVLAEWSDIFLVSGQARNEHEAETKARSHLNGRAEEHESCINKRNEKISELLVSRASAVHKARARDCRATGLYSTEFRI